MLVCKSPALEKVSFFFFSFGTQNRTLETVFIVCPGRYRGDGTACLDYRQNHGSARRSAAESSPLKLPVALPYVRAPVHKVTEAPRR